MSTSGSTAERGYTGEHVKLRRRWTPAVAAGQANCHEIICLHESRWIRPGTPWDLAHDRVTGGYRGPAHRSATEPRAPDGATRHAGTAAGTNRELFTSNRRRATGEHGREF